MNPSLVDIVLVRPNHPGNVAAACRALKNMGLTALTLVEPPAGLEDPGVRSLAYGAWDVLDGARRAASVRQATAECTLVAATSGRPAEGDWTPRRFAAEAAARAGTGRVAVVFGPEATGLRNDEMRLCQLRVRIPTDPAQPSLNLAQAVLIVAYEIFLSSAQTPAVQADPLARAGEIEAALDDLRAGLAGIGYLNPASPDGVLTELRRLLARARPTPREIVLLRGVARQIGWAARQIAQKRAGTDNGAPLGRHRK
jgi:TrmH family RNA methyltransferase